MAHVLIKAENRNKSCNKTGLYGNGFACDLKIIAMSRIPDIKKKIAETLGIDTSEFWIIDVGVVNSKNGESEMRSMLIKRDTDSLGELFSRNYEEEELIDLVGNTISDNVTNEPKKRERKRYTGTFVAERLLQARQDSEKLLCFNIKFENVGNTSGNGRRAAILDIPPIKNVKVKIDETQWSNRKNWTNKKWKLLFKNCNRCTMVQLFGKGITIKSTLGMIHTALAKRLGLDKTDFSIISLFSSYGGVGSGKQVTINLVESNSSDELGKFAQKMLDEIKRAKGGACGIVDKETDRSVVDMSEEMRKEFWLDWNVKGWQLEHANCKNDDGMLGFEIKFTDVKSTASNVGGTTATTSE